MTMTEVRNTSKIETSSPERILVVGRTGSGKTAQILTLPGKKFAYIFDPNSMKTLEGGDVDYVEFYPDFLEMDATIKGFNKNARADDKPPSEREPTTYTRWVEDINQRVETTWVENPNRAEDDPDDLIPHIRSNFFSRYDWLIIDSLTFLVKAIMDRQLYINRRYGAVEELADYRVVGSKMADVFGSLMGLPINIYCTGHIDTYQDDKTKKIETQLSLPGKARRVLPLQFTNIWLTTVSEDGKFQIRTIPESRGLQDIRNSIRGLQATEDVTIKDFNKAGSYGIGKLLKRKE